MELDDDLGQRVVLAANTLAWMRSPMAGVAAATSSTTKRL
jgi:hypothetical protein